MEGYLHFTKRRHLLKILEGSGDKIMAIVLCSKDAISTEKLDKIIR